MKRFEVENPSEKTLGEFIQKHYPDFTIWAGKAPMDMDISHGIEIEYADNRDNGYGEYLKLYPFVHWSDGGWQPCYYWGDKYYLYMEKR